MRAEEALEDLVAQLGRDAGPVVLDREHDMAVARARRWPRPRCPGRCGAARSPSGSARAGAARRCTPSTSAPAGADDRDLVVAGDRLELGGGVGDDARRGRRARCGGLAAGVGAGEQQQVGDEAAHAAASSAARTRRPRAARRRASPRAARGWPAREVSGVRSSCEASATNSRWRASAASVSARASSSACSISSSVVASSATSSSASGRGMLRRRVARARDLARGVGELGDRLHRAARGGQAGEQRERGAAEHAEAEEELHAVGRRLHVGDPAARTGRRP